LGWIRKWAIAYRDKRDEKDGRRYLFPIPYISFIPVQKEYMHDLKNILLAWVSAAPTFMAAVDGGNILTIVSAIILPTIFFLLGKAVDVGVQVYFREKKKDLQG